MLINKNLPYYQEQHNHIIPSDRQFFALTVGQRGSGKSATQELLLEILFEKGWTVFDSWSAGLESMFYCVNLNCKQKRREQINELENKLKSALDSNDEKNIEIFTKELISKKNELGCVCEKRYPITVLCNEAIDVDQKSLDRINCVYYTKEEWIQKKRNEVEPVVKYDLTDPPKKPLSERPKEWIKMVKLPFPNRANGTKNNQEIVRLFTEALISCRKERRILCYVPSLFPDDFARYRTLGIIITDLPKITDQHFKPFTENELDRPESKWSKYEKNYHRLCVLMRELAELAPQQMKTNEWANLTKRAVLSIIYTSRHSRLSLLCDVQKVESVFKEVRTMCNSIIIKRSTTSLLGEELKDVKKRIEENQNKLFDRFGKNEEIKRQVFTKHPPLEQLNKNYCYVLYNDDFLEKWHIPSTKHHKKQEDDDFYKLTGFSYKINEELIKSHKENKTTRTEEKNENDKELYDFINNLRNPHNGKGIGWKDIHKMAVEQQSKGKFKKFGKFANMKPDSIAKWYKRNFKKFRKIE